jgi:predicted kinase
VIYLVGGAPRSGKSILGQQVAAKLRIGWVATDVLRSMLKDEGAAAWDASPAAQPKTARAIFFWLAHPNCVPLHTHPPDEQL